MKQIGFYPEGSDESKYFIAMQKALNSLGYSVVSYEAAIKDKNIQIINFNFLENIIAKSKIIAFGKYLKRLMILHKCKKKGKKIVFTMHNKIPHDATYEKYSKDIMLRTIKQADGIHIFSKASVLFLQEYTHDGNIGDKCFYIPHPNYLVDYFPAISIDRNTYAKDDEMIILFFGQIRKYKNLEILISVANRLKDKKIVFLIAGRPESEEYKTELLKLINGNPAITTEFRFLPDDEIAAWIELSDTVVFPYSKRSSLTSGTVFLAASKGRTVICPNIATMDQMENKNAFFIYDYENESDHEEKLYECICRVYSVFRKDSNSLRQIGTLARQEVEKNNSKDVIAHQYKFMLEKLDK